MALTAIRSVAKQALPPAVICELLGFNKEEVKAAFEAGKPPTATEEQLINAVKQSVDPEVLALSFLTGQFTHTEI
jgi:hypothetical protein